MKISKKDLKLIVKECLVEILSEGLGNVLDRSSFSSAEPSPRSVPGNLVTSQRRVAESLTYDQPTPAPVQSAVRELSAARPDLASIFEDTARSTLQAQAEAERGMNMSALRGDTAAKVAAAATPDQLFGEETMNKWAALAFVPSLPSSKKV